MELPALMLYSNFSCLNSRHSSSCWLDSAAGVLSDKNLCGLVELYESNSGWVEAAFVVDQGWRRQGIASTLLRAAKEAATEIDIEVLRMIFPRDNWPMRQLANKANAKFDMVLDELSAEVAVSFT